MYARFLQSINNFWVSFYNWWYGALPVNQSERTKYIQSLVKNNKKQELDHRIENNFSSTDINELALFAINNKKHKIINSIRNLSKFPIKLSYKNENLLLQAYNASIKCFLELISILLLRTDSFTAEDNKCIKDALNFVNNKINETDHNNVFEVTKLNKFKNYLVKLLPYRHELLDESLTFNSYIAKIYEIHREKKIMEEEYNFNIPSFMDRTILANKILFKLSNGIDVSEEREALSYLDESIEFEKIFNDDEGYSLLTYVLSREDFEFEYFKMIAEINSEINFEFIEDHNYSFKDIENLFKNLITISANKSPHVDKVRQYALKGFETVCKSKGIVLNEGMTIDRKFNLFKDNLAEHIPEAQKACLYYLAARKINYQRLDERQLIIRMFDAEKINSELFVELAELFPIKPVLDKMDVKQFLKKEKFALNVMESVLNNFELNVDQMKTVFMFLNDNQADNRVVYQYIYLWFEKFSSNFKYLTNDLTDLFNPGHWNSLFSMNMSNFDIIKTLYSNYLFNLKVTDQYNPLIQEKLTLLADAINQNAFEFAKYVLNIISENGYIKQPTDIVQQIKGVTFDKAYNFLHKISYPKIDEVLFKLAKFYLDNNQSNHVKVGLEEISNLSEALLENIYVYILEHDLPYEHLLNLIRTKTYKNSLDNDLALIKRLIMISKNSDYKNIKLLFFRILSENIKIEYWSEEHIDSLMEILSKNQNARKFMSEFVIENQNEKEFYPLVVRFISTLISENNFSLFIHLSNLVFDDYLMDNNTQALHQWFLGVDNIADDVLQKLFDQSKYLQQLLTGFNLYENKHYDEFIKQFLTLCNRKNIDFSTLIAGLSFHDLKLIESLLSEGSSLSIYFNHYKNATYTTYLLNTLSDVPNGVALFDDVLSNTDIVLDELSVHKLLDEVIKLGRKKDARFSPFFDVSVNKLPEKFVSSYICKEEDIEMLEQLVLNNSKIRKMITFSNINHYISMNGLLEETGTYGLNDVQLINLWRQLLDCLRDNKRNASENILWFINRHSTKDELTSYFSQFFRDLPTFSKGAFNKFVLTMSKHPSFDQLIEKYLLEIDSWKMSEFSSQVATKKFDVKPMLNAVIRSIKASLERDKLQNSNHLDKLFSKLMKLKLFPLDISRKLILDNNLFADLVNLEMDLQPEQTLSGDYNDFISSENIIFVGTLMPRLLDVLKYSKLSQYDNLIIQSKLTNDQLTNYVDFERKVALFRSTFKFDSDSIIGKIPKGLVIRDEYKKIFLLAMARIINGSDNNKESAVNMLEWLEYDQLIRNTEKYENKFIDIKKVCAVLLKANDFDKAEATRIKDVLIDYLIAELQNIMKKIESNLLFAQEMNDKEKIDYHTLQNEKGEKEINELMELKNGIIRKNFDKELFPSVTSIIDSCRGKETYNDIIEALINSLEGRKLLEAGQEKDMKPFYEAVFQNAISEYLEINKQAQKMLNLGHVLNSSIDEEELDKHSLKSKTIAVSDPLEVQDMAPIYNELNDLLFIIQYMMTWHNVDPIMLYEKDKALMLEVLNHNGCYEFPNLKNDRRHINLGFVENYFDQNIQKMEKLEVRPLSGQKFQSMFSLPSNEEAPVARRSSLLSRFTNSR